MKKLLRILFVISAIAFVVTLTACANNKTPGFFKFTAAAAGVTIDESKDVVKITINPSLLTYAAAAGAATANTHAGNFALAPAPIFTVTFADDKLQGFIIPTTAAKADALTTLHIAALADMGTNDVLKGVDAINNITYSYLALAAPGFRTTEVNTAWSAPINRTAVNAIVVAVPGNSPELPIVIEKADGIANILESSKVRVSCATKMTGITALSFAAAKPADAKDDLAIAKGTETVCLFSLVGEGTDDEKKAAYKAWATAAVAAAKDDPTKNIQKMGFVGIVTGKNKASEITKTAGAVIGVDGIVAATSVKLVKAYDSVLQKVEIVIAEAK